MKCKSIKNTSEFVHGDVAIVLPSRNDIHKIGEEYRVHRFIAESIDYENDYVIMYDLDNMKHLKPNLDMDINSRMHTILVLKNVFD